LKVIGGYFELELRKGEEFHKNAIRLNSGRNALEYILRSRGYKKAYLPYYTCYVILEPINKLKLEYEFYHINEHLEPMFNYSRVGVDESFIYTNYFGIKSQVVKKLSSICPNLIIDNSQAFFEKPIIDVDTFYSPRKFFGLPDGAYLYAEKYLNIKLSRDNSVARFKHLIKRIDEGPEQGYPDFKANDDALKEQPIKRMSSLTQALLCNIDYDKVIKTRKQNFQFLHEHLYESNQLELPEDKNFVPMVFPYLSANGINLKQKLIQKGVFVATYWPNVLNDSKKGEFEYYLAEQNVCLPIDQRYGIKEMKNIIKILT
jgi:hypothetical protein